MGLLNRNQLLKKIPIRHEYVLMQANVLQKLVTYKLLGIIKYNHQKIKKAPVVDRHSFY